jgi:class 3 adenylate cyclase
VPDNGVGCCWAAGQVGHDRRAGTRPFGPAEADRPDFTAIGPAVILVSWLEGLCRPLGRSVLISGAVAAETTTPLVR